MHDVDLRKEFEWRSRHNTEPITAGEEKLLKMPTLYMRPFKLNKAGRDDAKFEVELLQE